MKVSFLIALAASNTLVSVPTAPIASINSQGVIASKSGISAAAIGLKSYFMNSVGPLFGGIFNAIFFPITPSPEEVYVKMWGLIQNQVSNSILAKNKAQLTQTLSTLTMNINQQITGYLSQLNLLGQTQASLIALLARNGGVLRAPTYTVDTFMKGIDTILSASLDWYNPIAVNLSNPSAFILASAEKGICLHTQDYKVQDGTPLVADNECDLNTLSDKMFYVGDNSTLYMRTQEGLKCISYNDKTGTKTKKTMAIFSVESRQCRAGKKISLHHHDTGFGLFDGIQNMLCINKKKGKKNLNTIVTRRRGNKCKDDGLLLFDTMIPIILNDPKIGGVSGSSITPSRSFEEIGLQLYYFSNIATIHLLALKELYNFGTLQSVAKTQFENKIGDYKDWLEKVVPIYTAYSKIMGLDAKAQLDEAQTFYEMLGTASLVAKPIQWNPPVTNQVVQTVQQVA